MSDDNRTCNRCGVTCDRGYSEQWRGEERVSVHCLDCAQTLRLEAYAKDRRLSLALVEHAWLGAPTEYRADTWRHPLEEQIYYSARRLHRDVKAFERGVWFAGAQPLAQNARTKGTSADLGNGLKLLCWTMCGRAMLTIQGPEDSVTVMTEEDRKDPGGMGLRGIDATEETARKLIHDAIAAWQAGARLTEDREVRYL